MGLHATGSVVVVALCGGLVILRVCWMILVVNVGICVAMGGLVVVWVYLCLVVVG